MSPTVNLSRTLVFAVINFFILSVIFISTLIVKPGTLYMNAFIYGLSLSLIAAGVFIVIDYLSGGVASMAIFILYPLAGMAMLVLSLISPICLHDIHEKSTSRISAYKLWSVVFWPIFIVIMLVCLSVGALVSYLGMRMSQLAMSMIVTYANGYALGTT